MMLVVFLFQIFALDIHEWVESRGEHEEVEQAETQNDVASVAPSHHHHHHHDCEHCPICQTLIHLNQSTLCNMDPPRFDSFASDKVIVVSFLSLHSFQWHFAHPRAPPIHSPILVS